MTFSCMVFNVDIENSSCCNLLHIKQLTQPLYNTFPPHLVQATAAGMISYFPKQKIDLGVKVVFAPNFRSLGCL
jgi:hypothetical protein